jgi:hypothetical protein
VEIGHRAAEHHARQVRGRHLHSPITLPKTRPASLLSHARNNWIRRAPSGPEGEAPIPGKSLDLRALGFWGTKVSPLYWRQPRGCPGRFRRGTE